MRIKAKDESTARKSSKSRDAIRRKPKSHLPKDLVAFEAGVHRRGAARSK